MNIEKEKISFLQCLSIFFFSSLLSFCLVMYTQNKNNKQKIIDNSFFVLNRKQKIGRTKNADG
jgi:hypothetical protein